MNNFDNYKNIYLVGIKGGGMASLTLLLQEIGKQVTGSDTDEKFYTDEVLDKHKIKYFEKFNPSNINNNIDLVIYSTAYLPDKNVELIAARKKNIPIINYPAAVGILMKEKKSIGVAGTHGKTTITAMLAFVLKESSFNPSAMIGSNVPQLGGTTLIGESDIFVVETDEYQNKFQYYHPQTIILNNIDWDHPDFFADNDSYQKVFLDYVKKLPADGCLIANLDDDNVKKVSEAYKGNKKYYGLKSDKGWQARKLGINQSYQIFTVYRQNKKWGEVKLKLFGEFNVLNSLAVIAAADYLGVSKNDIIKALSKFVGTQRRFEFIGEISGCQIFDDFAHHPSEIQATLKMAKQRYEDKKIITVFHPHTYTRTEKFIDNFAVSFNDSDEVLILDIYSSAREKVGKIDSKKLTEIIDQKTGNAKYVRDIVQAVEYLKNKINKNYIVITMGAGDVWRVGRKLLNKK